MIFNKKEYINTGYETSYEHHNREQRRLVQYINMMNYDFILCDLEIVLMLSMEMGYSPTTIPIQNDILEYSKGKFVHVGTLYRKKIFIDYSYKLDKFEFIEFDSLEAIRNKIVYNNRLEKLERILEDDGDDDNN